MGKNVEQQGVPFSITLHKKPDSLEEMSKEDLDLKLSHSLKQAQSRQGKPMNEVFEAIERKHS
ncbi:MAG: hypothetical protein IKS07_04365 [Lachnospiraceae bacterium]|nr:hypothetical protein [Lachnospiraceae bacterium]